MTYVLLRQFQYGHLGTATLCQDSHFIVDHLRIPGAALEASGQCQFVVKRCCPSREEHFQQQTAVGTNFS